MKKIKRTGRKADSLLFSRGEKTRTSDLHVPNVARCQLCYTPIGDRKGNEIFYIATTFFIKNLK